MANANVLHARIMGPAMHGEQTGLILLQPWTPKTSPLLQSCRRRGIHRHCTRCSKVEQTRQGSNGSTGLGLIENGSNGSVSVLPVELPPELTSIDPDTNGGAGSGGGEDGAGGRGGGGDDDSDGQGGRGRSGRSWLPDMLRRAWRPRTLLALLFVMGYQVRRNARRAREAGMAAAAEQATHRRSLDLDTLLSGAMQTPETTTPAGELSPPNFLVTIADWAPWRLARKADALRQAAIALLWSTDMRTARLHAHMAGELPMCLSGMLPAVTRQGCLPQG